MDETRSQLGANNGILVCLVLEIWQFKLFAGKEVTAVPATRGEGGYWRRGRRLLCLCWNWIALSFLAATKQLYEWYFLSVCPSVRLSVRLSVCPSVRLSVCLSVRLSVCPSVTPFWLCSHHRIIMKFSGVITLDQGKVHAKGQGQRSKVKVTEVTTQIFVSGL